jgi:hypothetical protein
MINGCVLDTSKMYELYVTPWSVHPDYDCGSKTFSHTDAIYSLKDVIYRDSRLGYVFIQFIAFTDMRKHSENESDTTIDIVKIDCWSVEKTFNYFERIDRSDIADKVIYGNV